MMATSSLAALYAWSVFVAGKSSRKLDTKVHAESAAARGLRTSCLQSVATMQRACFSLDQETKVGQKKKTGATR